MDIILGKEYNLKEEFLPLLNITQSTYKNKRVELLDWWKDFFDYEIRQGKPLKIIIHKIYGEYTPLPRKSEKQTAQKIADYESYVKTHLSKNFVPESKMRMARNAIEDFSGEKYGHTSSEGVARRYAGPAMEKLGEKSEERVWVDSASYMELTPQLLSLWREILHKYKIGQEEAANAFYVSASGGDISKELTAYKLALSKFKDVTGIVPICVRKWRLAIAE